MDVAIIDYQMSNLHSVSSACEHVGLSSKITSNTKEIMDSKIAILPGVGAFGEAMSHLKKSKLDDCIIKFIGSKNLFLAFVLDFNCFLKIVKNLVNTKVFRSYKRCSQKILVFLLSKNVKYSVPQIGYETKYKKNFYHGRTQYYVKMIIMISCIFSLLLCRS